MKFTLALAILMSVFLSLVMSKSYLVEVDDGMDYRRRKVGVDMGGDYADGTTYDGVPTPSPYLGRSQQIFYLLPINSGSGRIF